jgi:hypothetical protein
MTTKNGCRFKRNKGSERYTKDWFVINQFIDRIRHSDSESPHDCLPVKNLMGTICGKFMTNNLNAVNKDTDILVKMATDVVNTYTWHHLHKSQKKEIIQEVRHNIHYITTLKILIIILEGDNDA